MILTTHGIVGAATARVFGWHPLTAFIAAMASHYLLDALPHWDYNLRSHSRDEKNFLNDNMVINRDFVFDFIKIAFDGLAGFFLAFAIFQPENSLDILTIGIGVIGGMLPDFLQFVYFKFRYQPFIWHQRFHHWIHTDIWLKDKWLSGGALQILIIIACVAISQFFVS